MAAIYRVLIISLAPAGLHDKPDYLYIVLYMLLYAYSRLQVDGHLGNRDKEVSSTMSHSSEVCRNDPINCNIVILVSNVRIHGADWTQDLTD